MASSSSFGGRDGSDTKSKKDIVKRFSISLISESRKLPRAGARTQVLAAQTVIDLARSTKKDPRDYIVRFFGNMERDQSNVSKFMKEVDDFSEKIKGRAIEKKKEEERRKRWQRSSDWILRMESTSTSS